MKSSKFSIISFVISFLVLIQALIAFVDLPETYSLAPILFPLVLLLYLPDYPLGYLPQILGVPIVLPLLSIIFALVGLRKGENKKIFSIIGIILIVISTFLFLGLRFAPLSIKPSSDLQLSATNGIVPFTVRIVGPLKLVEKGVGEARPWTRCGFTIDWGDKTPYPKTKDCASWLMHTYNSSGSFKISARIYHLGPVDESITDWSGTKSITIYGD